MLKEPAVDTDTVELEVPVLDAEMQQIADERQAQRMEAYNSPKRSNEENEKLRQKSLANRRFDWAVMAGEFEAVQQVYGTEQALSNFAFEIAVTICVQFAPGCHGLIMNDGSPEMQKIIGQLVNQGEDNIRPSDPIPRDERATFSPAAPSPETTPASDPS